nr:MAG TPA: hypothetical protein [Caudoviricetes sp.]
MPFLSGRLFVYCFDRLDNTAALLTKSTGKIMID